MRSRARTHARVQMGPAYLKLCDGLNVAPAAALMPAIQLALHAPALRLAAAGARRAAGDGDGVDEDGAPLLAARLVPEDLTLEVVCVDTVATLYPATCRVRVNGKEMTATQFEQHAGAGSAKKWKTSLRILPGQVPECPPGARRAAESVSTCCVARGATKGRRNAADSNVNQIKS